MPLEPSIVHVIDDDEALRESLTFLLRTADLEAKSYASAAAFLDVLPLAGDYELAVLHTSTPSFASDVKVAEALKDTNPKLKIGMVGAKVATSPIIGTTTGMRERGKMM